MIPTIILVAVLLFAVALLFFIPTRDVTQPPGKRQPFWEVLFPGTSPAWHVFGGIVLIAWTYFVIQGLMLVFMGTPYMISGISMPTTLNYGIPPPAATQAFSRSLIQAGFGCTWPRQCCLQSIYS